jgi:hypothetical protein
MDAIHLATAKLAKADWFITSETKKYRRNCLLNFQFQGAIGDPPIKISLPTMEMFLPLLEEKQVVVEVATQVEEKQIAVETEQDDPAKEDNATKEEQARPEAPEA